MSVGEESSSGKRKRLWLAGVEVIEVWPVWSFPSAPLACALLLKWDGQGDYNNK